MTPELRDRALQVLGWPNRPRTRDRAAYSEAELIGLLMLELDRVAGVMTASISLSHIAAIIEVIDRTNGAHTMSLLSALCAALEAVRKETP
jgi:hypothetical protein